MHGQVQRIVAVVVVATLVKITVVVAVVVAVVVDIMRQMIAFTIWPKKIKNMSYESIIESWNHRPTMSMMNIRYQALER